MATLVECSRELIQSVELGRAPLSEKLAKRIVLATGINLFWLTGNDPKAPPTDTATQPYTRESFERARAGGDPHTETTRALNRSLVVKHLHDIFAVYVAAENTSIQATYIFRLRLGKFFQSLWSEFGFDSETFKEKMAVEKMTSALAMVGPAKKGRIVRLNEDKILKLTPRRRKPKTAKVFTQK